MLELLAEIKILTLKIDAIEQLLKKTSQNWTEEEKDEFGSHEQLRKKEEQLRELLILKEKQTILLIEQNQGIAMDIDSEDGQVYNHLRPKPKQSDASDINWKPIAKDVSMKEIVSQISIQTIISISESNLNVEQNPSMSFQVPIVDGKHNVLYSSHFYNCLNENKVMPFPQLIGTSKLHSRATMLIGTSGSGKTATCFELGRKNYSIYIDCFADSDFRFFLEKSKMMFDKVDDGELYCKQLYLKLIHARYCLLNKIFAKKTLPEHKTPWKWFSYQRSGSFQNAVKDILYKTDSDILELLQMPTYGDIKVSVIMIDEANYLLNILENKICNSAKVKSRPLLYLVVQVNQWILNTPHVYAGTHLSMKDQSLVLSGAGGKDDNVDVITQFDFYSQETIQYLLEKSLTSESFVQLQNNRRLLNYCCAMLQGRVRFFSMFLQRLSAQSDKPFLEHFEKTLEDYIAFVTEESKNLDDKFSLFSFWKRNHQSTAFVLTGSEPKGISIFDCLIDLLINYFINDSPKKISYNIDLVDSALTKLYKEGHSSYEYTMDEPLALVAGIRFLSTCPKNYLAESIQSKMFGSALVTEQHFGILFEFLIAVLSLKPWWQTIPDNDDIWKRLPKEVRTHLKSLGSPTQIIKQRKRTDNGQDWSLLNFIIPPNFFVLPDKNLGPDGIYDIMCFNCKTTSKKHVSSTESAKNYEHTKIENWGAAKDNNRKKAFKVSVPQHLVFFQLEFPYPQYTTSFETNDQRSIIPLHLDSSISQYIFPKEFLDEWKSKLEK